MVDVASLLAAFFRGCFSVNVIVLLRARRTPWRCPAHAAGCRLSFGISDDEFSCMRHGEIVEQKAEIQQEPKELCGCLCIAEHRLNTLKSGVSYFVATRLASCFLPRLVVRRCSVLSALSFLLGS